MELAIQKNPIAPAAPTDVARLTRLMQRGDEEAYREFFQRYFHRLFAYLLVVARGNEQTARDLVQQTMIKVAKHIRVFDEEEPLWRWLTLLARTAAVDEGRKAQRYFSFLDRWRRQSSEPTEAPEVNDAVVDELLTSGIQTLENEDREVLTRKYFEGRSVREIAADLGMTEKAVESRLTRARTKLKENVLKGLKDA